MTRCRAGDLAEIVHTHSSNRHLLGVRIVVTEKKYTYTHAWRYATFHGSPLLSGEGMPIEFAEDYCLRPIRGPELEDGRPNSIDVSEIAHA